MAVAVDAEAVVVGLSWEDFLDVFLGLLDDVGFGPDRVKVYGNGSCFGGRFRGHV